MLEGTLRDFPVADVLRLLASTGKTGRLVLTGQGRGGVVALTGGQLRFADVSGDGLGLARRLASADLLEDATIEELATRTPEVLGQGLRLLDELVDVGVAVEDLRAITGDYVTDEIGQLLDWSDGSFAFEGGDVGAAAGLALEVVGVIEQAQMRLEEHRRVASALPDAADVLVLAGVADDQAVTADQWRVIALVDGRRTVGEVVTLLGVGTFRGADLVRDALGSKLVESRPAGGGPALPAVAVRMQRLDELAARQRATGNDAEEGAAASRPTAREAAAPPAAEPSSRLTPVSRPDAIEQASGGRAPERQLTTDPSIDEELVRRLIDGVKEL